MRRLASLLLCLTLLLSLQAASALSWPEGTGEALRQYFDAVNARLQELGAMPVNSVFESYPTFAVLGVTDAGMAEVPEQVELTVYLQGGELHYLQLRVTDALDRFPAIAAACIMAASPEEITQKDALKQPTACLERVYKTPLNSFESVPDTLRGETVRTYYAYYPSQYPMQDPPVRCLQMTLVFPLPGYGDLNSVTPPPDGYTVNPYNGDGTSEWNDNRPIEDLRNMDDEYEPDLHLNITLSPTPEPDIDWNATPAP